MKKYSVNLYFAKYDLDEIVKVNNLEEIRLIAENIAYRMKSGKSSDESTCVCVDICVLEEYEHDEDDCPFDCCQIYVTPHFHVQYINNKTGELIENSCEKFKNFFEMLFKYRIFSTYKRLEPDKAPCLKGGD